jgi:hypothetical protein
VADGYELMGAGEGATPRKASGWDKLNPTERAEMEVIVSRFATGEADRATKARFYELYAKTGGSQQDAETMRALADADARDTENANKIGWTVTKGSMLGFLRGLTAAPLDFLVQMLTRDKVKGEFSDLITRNAMAGETNPELLGKSMDTFEVAGNLVFFEVLQGMRGAEAKIETEGAGTQRTTVKITRADFEAYLKFCEEQTHRDLTPNQRIELMRNFEDVDGQFTKLPPGYKDLWRVRFNKMRADLRKEWAQETKQDWPTHATNVYNADGVLTIQKGAPYDAHELIPNLYRGPIKWSNIMPARNPDQHQGGIHGKGSPIFQLFPKGKSK